MIDHGKMGHCSVLYSFVKLYSELFVTNKFIYNTHCKFGNHGKINPKVKLLQKILSTVHVGFQGEIG